MKVDQLLIVVILASAIGSPIGALAEEKRVVQKMKGAAAHLRIEGELPSLDGATEWLNSEPLTAASLRRTVVLIDVWPIPA